MRLNTRVYQRTEAFVSFFAQFEYKTFLVTALFDHHYGFEIATNILANRDTPVKFGLHGQSSYIQRQRDVRQISREWHQSNLIIVAQNLQVLPQALD